MSTVSVTDFGAVGDGVTDDTLAIKNALNSLDPGDTLVFPQGKTFVHTDTITVGKATSSSQTIDGSATKTLYRYDSITVASDGANWIVI